MSEHVFPDGQVGVISTHDHRLRQITDIRAGNQNVLSELLSNGVQFDTSTLLHIRVQLLAQALLGEDRALDVDLQFEQAVQAILGAISEQVRQQIARATLLGSRR